MPRKKTNEEFLKKLEEKGRFDIKPLEEYKGAHEKILFECLRDKNHPNWYTEPANILSGSKCPHCREHPYISRYDFEQKLKD